MLRELLLFLRVEMANFLACRSEKAISLISLRPQEFSIGHLTHTSKPQNDVCISGSKTVVKIQAQHSLAVLSLTLSSEGDVSHAKQTVLSQ